MRWLLVLLIAFPAFAHDDCVAGAKHINLNDGSSTAGYTGIVRCYDSDTKEETQSMSFLNGKLTGREKRKWNNGESMEQEYREGRRHGEYRKYQDGKLTEVSHYVDDRELGEALRYSPSGKLIRKLVRREPDAASTWQNFDEAGRLLEAGCGLQASLEAGLSECKWPGSSPLVFFHPNGQKRAVVELRDGLRNGLTTTFDRDGVKVGEMRFTKGQRDGLWVEFDAGKPRRSVQFVAGKIKGEETEFFEDGAKKKVIVWRDGQHERLTEFFQNGAKKFERVRDGEQFIEARFDDDGRLVDRMPFRGGQRSGAHEQFLPDGGVSLRESYIDSRLQGRRQAWFDDGRLAEDSTWDRGNVTTRKRWDSDGGLVEDEAFYEDGSRKKKRP